MNTLMDKLDNLMNPVVVKELRQAVGGKFVTGVLMLFITVQLVAIGFALFAFDINDDSYGGFTFWTLLLIMMITCMVFVPAYAAMRLVTERTGTQSDLLYITTIRPGQIVAGKFLSAMMVTVLIFAACMPFLSLTYLLRGIDLPTIFLLLFINFVVIAMSTMFAIFLACVPASRGLRSMLGLAGIATLVGVLVRCMVYAENVVRRGGSTGANEWIALMVTVISIAAVTGLLYVLSVAMISPVSSNRAMPVRIYLTVVWLITAVFMAVLSIAENEYWPIWTWMIIMGLILFTGLLVAVSERDEIGGRLRRTIPRTFVLRAPAFFLFSGSAGGVAWTIGLLGATAAFGFVWESVYRGSMDGQRDMIEFLKTSMPFALYFIGYSLTALWIRRVLLNWIIYPAYTWAMALIMMAAGIILPFVMAFILHGYNWDREMAGTHWFFATVPFMAFVWDGAADMVVWYATSGVWAGIGLALNLAWWADRLLAFRPDVIAGGSRDSALAAEELGDDGVEHPASLRYWVHTDGDGARVYGHADGRVFWAGVPLEDWARVETHLEAGRLPTYMLRDFGRVVPVDAITRIKSVVNDTAVDIDYRDGHSAAYTRLRAADLADRDAFVNSVGDLAGARPDTRSVNAVLIAIKPGVVLALLGLFTWACWTVVAELRNNPAMESVIRAKARGFKSMIIAMSDWCGQTGLIVGCVTLLLLAAGWLIMSTARRPKMLVIEKRDDATAATSPSAA
ncbi:MAG: hypothetical protein GC159_10795 [Phycisphaera sp.]|nr:hypothetical protein [Phycisphaera sp.]